ncbi:hypothetical protein PsalMR5_04179 (plasmid) [Piscirickettsia salmonis]|nr:hypothetical protein PsalSR1_04176 [Piscirickettsia salmonis]QGP61700.1 hypothetical protein PsalBI1_04342 [Piscirickettsia salmonis]QGP66254.1 hypothetical protein PsalMR5_04179 [Piscirickettsia salmonis]
MKRSKLTESQIVAMLNEGQCSGQVKQDTFLREFSKLTGDRYSFAV